MRVARIGQRMKSADPLPPSIWRDKLRSLAYWMLVGFIGVIVWPTLAYLLLRLS